MLPTILAAAALTAVSYRHLTRSRRSQFWGRGFHRGARGKHQIALTFDDGPSRSTLRILDVLERHHARATFFSLGANVERLPEVSRAVHQRGHVIGNHTYSHPSLLYLPAVKVRGEISRTQEIIENTVGLRPRFFRPPYGIRAPSFRTLLPELGLTNVMWTVTGNDWKWDKSRIVKRVMNGLRDGGIICLHDGRALDIEASCEQTLLALEEIISRLEDTGFHFVTAAQMIEELNGTAVRGASA